MKKGIDIPVIIGTRGSELALWQARFTQDELLRHGIRSELKIIKTHGDATQAWNLSFDKLEGKGFFTKELEEALLNREIDLAVHSCKDLPTEYPDGLTIAAYSKRANPFDILLIRKEKAVPAQFLQLPVGALVGTSSARRKAQLLALRPDIDIRDLRGNVPTRIQKLHDRQYDAILLARAGLDRLGIELDDFVSVELSAPMFIPAPAQGVLAFQIREDDADMKTVSAILNNSDSEKITNIERQLLHDFEGGCQMPLGIYSEPGAGQMQVWISQASSWNALPKRMRLLVNQDFPFDPKQVVDQFKSKPPVPVFFSSNLSASDYAVRVLHAHGYPLNSHSLLEFSAVDFHFEGHADWIFFSSRNAIRFFFDRVDKDKLSGIKLAAVGESTAQALRDLGLVVDFTGDGAGATSAKLFEQSAQGQVLFPMAANSLRSVQENITPGKLLLTDLVVYQNLPRRAIEKRSEKILVFSSPMNAMAYFEKHALDPGQAVIANGPSTSQKLEEFGVPHQVSYSPYPWSILDEIFSI